MMPCYVIMSKFLGTKSLCWGESYGRIICGRSLLGNANTKSESTNPFCLNDLGSVTLNVELGLCRVLGRSIQINGNLPMKGF